MIKPTPESSHTFELPNGKTIIIEFDEDLVPSVRGEGYGQPYVDDETCDSHLVVWPSNKPTDDDDYGAEPVYPNNVTGPQ